MSGVSPNGSAAPWELLLSSNASHVAADPAAEKTALVSKPQLLPERGRTASSEQTCRPGAGVPAQVHPPVGSRPGPSSLPLVSYSNMHKGPSRSPPNPTNTVGRKLFRGGALLRCVPRDQLCSRLVSGTSTTPRSGGAWDHAPWTHLGASSASSSR